MAAEPVFDEEPIATMRTLRRLRTEINAIAEMNGIRNLRVTAEGRLYGTVDHSRPYSGILSFEQHLAELLGLHVDFVSDGALHNLGNDDEHRLQTL